MRNDAADWLVMCPAEGHWLGNSDSASKTASRVQADKAKAMAAATKAEPRNFRSVTAPRAGDGWPPRAAMAEGE